MIFNKEIIEQLSKELSLPFTGVEQDWDLEMADSNRISDFLKFYQQNDFNSDKKAALMALIIASYEDFLNVHNIQIDDKWDEIKSILESARMIFVDLIDYWSLRNGVEEENLFRITTLIRMIK